MKHLIPFLLLLAACAPPNKLLEELPEQGPAKDRAALENTFDGCRYLDQVRDQQNMPLPGFTLQVLWGSVFVRNDEGVQIRIPGETINLEFCDVVVAADNTYQVVFK